MCGRFVRYVSIFEILSEFEINQPEPDIKPSYNIPPGQHIAVIINDGKKRLVSCKWGFIPSWAKDPAIGYKMINARGESVAEKASFKGAFKNQRCLIAANGFYEWRKDRKIKTPFYIRVKSRKTFGFAGLYNKWTTPEGVQICTTTIITTNANTLLQPIHNRMPNIIHKDKESLWLDPGVQDPEVLLSILKPYPYEDMEFHKVSPIVNSPGNDSAECIKPA